MSGGLVMQSASALDSSAASSINNVSKFTCSICTQGVVDPVSPSRTEEEASWRYVPIGIQAFLGCTRKVQRAACEHVFCQKCFQDMIATSKRLGTQPMCPNCRREVDSIYFDIEASRRIEIGDKLLEALLLELEQTPDVGLDEITRQIGALHDDTKRMCAINSLIRICVKLKRTDYILELKKALGNDVSSLQVYIAFSEIGQSYASEGNIQSAMNMIGMIPTRREDGMVAECPSLRDKIRAQVVRYLFDHNDKEDKFLRQAMDVFEQMDYPDLFFSTWANYQAFQSGLKRIKASDALKLKCHELRIKSVLILAIVGIVAISWYCIRLAYKK